MGHWEEVAGLYEGVGPPMRHCTVEVKVRAYLLQSLSVAVLRGDVASVLESVGEGEEGWSGLDLFSM